MKTNLAKVLLVGFICVFILLATSCCRYKKQQAESEKFSVGSIDETIEVSTETKGECSGEIEEESSNSKEVINLGEFKITAYCSCEACCNSFAHNRPVDEYGNEIVYGSTGERLAEGVSIAVDPSVIPYGTEVIIDEHTYIAQDTGGAINGNRIDVYMSDHQKALDFGVQYLNVYIKTE